MNCADLREYLVETARGRELSSDLRARVFAHATVCRACAARLDMENRLTAVLRDVAFTAPSAPARLEQTIMRQLPVPIRGRKPSVWAWSSLAAAAAVAAFALVTYQKPALPPKHEDPVTVESASSDDFVALPYAAALSPSDSTNIVRLEVSRESLLSVGFPVSGDNLDEVVDADVVLGPDGTPRAIRIAN